MLSTLNLNLLDEEKGVRYRQGHFNDSPSALMYMHYLTGRSFLVGDSVEEATRPVSFLFAPERFQLPKVWPPRSETLEGFNLKQLTTCRFIPFFYNGWALASF